MKTITARELDEFRSAHGEWTAHNIHLGDGLFTIGVRPVAEVEGIKRLVQTAVDLAGRPADQLRVLDLGCGEGGCGIEFARHGARVVCVDGREENLRKGRFVQEALGLTQIEFHQDDVRNLSESRYGRFDVVLCVGLLYHLDAPGVFDLLRAMADVTDRVAFVHTYVSVGSTRVERWHDHEYRGRAVLEHVPGADKVGAVWGSLDNDFSFWPTRASLLNALMDAGFTSVLDCRVPWVSWQSGDHVTLAAVKGTAIPTFAVPAVDAVPAVRVPERIAYRVHPAQTWFYPLARRIMAATPRGVKNAIDDALRRVGGLGLWWATSKKAPRV